MRKALLKIIDFFYPPFSRWFTPKTFRYLCTGGTTAVTGIIAYFVIYNYILFQKDIKFEGFLITGHTAALILESMFTFSVGFVLNKYLVFTQSTLKGRIQIFRYATIVATNILLNLALLKIMVESFGWYPSISKAIITFILAFFSYFSQKHFSFKEPK